MRAAPRGRAALGTTKTSQQMKQGKSGQVVDYPEEEEDVVEKFPEAQNHRNLLLGAILFFTLIRSLDVYVEERRRNISQRFGKRWRKISQSNSS